jgi:hypothetical protein
MIMTPIETAAGGAADAGPLALICCGGTLPYAVADAAAARGRRVVLFPLRGIADPVRVAAYPHRWIALGQFGRFARLAKEEGCRDVVFIGNLVRPALTQIRFDLATLKLLPRLIPAFRGGDDHLLSAIGHIFEERGFRMLGAHEVAPEIVLPEGAMGRSRPDARGEADIERGLALLRATSPFDIGQAVVIADNHVLAVEAAEGTDAMLARVAALRGSGRIRAPAGRGVLVKAPKLGQDRRFDLPSIGPHTVENVARAGLAGIAVVAGGTIVAEPQRLIELADRADIFVIGVRDAGAAV